MKKIVLIGGAPLTGKTTLAKKLSKLNGAIVLQSDYVRSFMQKLLVDSTNSDLFYRFSLSPEELYSRFSPKEIFDFELAQAKEVQKGIRHLVKSHYRWDNLIIEGIAVTPEFATELVKEFQDTQFEIYFSHCTDFIELSKRLQERGLWDQSNSYSKKIKRQELAWVKLFNAYIIKETKKYNLDLKLPKLV